MIQIFNKTNVLQKQVAELKEENNRLKRILELSNEVEELSSGIEATMWCVLLTNAMRHLSAKSRIGLCKDILERTKVQVKDDTL